MKSFLVAAVLAAASLPGFAGNLDVGVSIGISQPGVYGRVDIGRYPQPRLVMPQPVYIAQPVLVPVQPVYMWVPVVHQQDWGRSCSSYGACGVPVYFVQDRWYRDHVAADRYYQRRDANRYGYEDGRAYGPGKWRGKDRGHGHHKH